MAGGGNPNHDKDGRFSSGPGGGGGEPKQHPLATANAHAVNTDVHKAMYGNLSPDQREDYRHQSQRGHEAGVHGDNPHSVFRDYNQYTVPGSDQRPMVHAFMQGYRKGSIAGAGRKRFSYGH